MKKVITFLLTLFVVFDTWSQKQGENLPPTGPVEISAEMQSYIDHLMGKDKPTPTDGMPAKAATVASWSYPSSTPSTPFGGGAGTFDNPYLISTAQHLANLSYLVNNGTSYSGYYFKMTSNIVLNNNVLDTDGSLNSGSFQNWTPIGGSSYFFKGSFDGDGHHVSGIYINAPSSSYQGLFGHVVNGSISNLGLEDSYINAYDHSGGLIGECDFTSISLCYNCATVIAHFDIGGIVGNVYTNHGTSGTSSQIVGCANFGKINATGSCVAGITGFASGTSISYCANYGTIGGTTSDNGGIQGQCGSSMSNCINFGSANYAIGSSGVSNSYYLAGSCTYAGSAISKTATEFADGTVLSLLDPTESYFVQGANYPVIKGIGQSNTVTEEITIGTGTSMGYLPHYIYYCNTTTQFAYTPEEVGNAGKITKIAFNVAQAASQTPTSLKIYMCHKSNFISSSSDYITSGTLVYSGSPTLASKTGWESISLDTPFEYNGTDNLVIAVCRQNGSYVDGKYYCSTLTSGYSLYRRSDSDSGFGNLSYSASYTSTTERPNIMITKVCDGRTVSTSSVGEGTKKSSSPYVTDYKYSTTQMFYTPEEVGEGRGLITKLAFNVANTGSHTPTSLHIYMGHRSSVIGGSGSYTQLSNLTEVYSGTPTLGSVAGWETLELDTPFDYDGVRNLVVVVSRKSSTTTSNSYYCTPLTTGYTLKRESDSDSNYGSAESTTGYNSTRERPDVQFTKLMIEPVKVELDTTELELWVNQNHTFIATITPADALDKKVKWSSSNSSVAEVYSTGKMYARSKGTAIITATTSNGKSASSSVIVKQQVKTIELSDTIVTMWVNDSKTLSGIAYPTNANDRTVKWKSSNTAIATVNSSGVVTAKSAGTCIITCYAADGRGAKSTCEVTVNQQVASIDLSLNEVSIWVGNKRGIQATVGPENAMDKGVIWTSSDPTVATVTALGTVQGIKKGTCTITCTAKDGYGTSATCAVTVKQQVTSVSLGITKLTLKAGMSHTLSATVLPSNANNKSLSWTSSDDTVAKVSSAGVVTAIKPGTVTITCTAKDRNIESASCTVVVNPLKIWDSSPEIPEATYGEESIWYSRSIQSGKYYPFCLPFDIDLSDYSGLFEKVYIPMELALLKPSGSLMLLFEDISQTQTIQAGHPFVVLGAANESVTFKNSNSGSISTQFDPDPVEQNVYDFNGSNGFLSQNGSVLVQIVGTYHSLSGLDGGSTRMLSSNGTLYSGTSISSFRFYVSYNEIAGSYVQELLLSFGDDGETAIEEIMNASESFDTVYNVNGQRVSRTGAEHGIYIINGKKVHLK